MNSQVTPDWQKLVREKITNLRLSPSQGNEIVAELASHLEECYEQYRKRGLSEARAVNAALEEVSNWRRLRGNIRRARLQEDEMNQRTKAVWIPGLVTGVLASGVLALLQVWGVRPHIVWMRSGLALLFYIPWLVAQPLFGAAGAYVSRRLGGTRNERLVAATFPSIATLFTFCVMLAIMAGLNIFTLGDPITHFRFVGLALYILLWAVIPGLALALGAVPFLRNGGTAAAH